MILKCGLNLNKKKPKKPATSAPNVFAQLRSADDPEHTVASQIAAQSQRQKLKAEQEKLKLLAEDPNVYAFDEVYDSMAEKKRGQIAAKLNADAERKPKYFDKLVKRVEERKVEQGVIYQRGIVKERMAEDKMFSQTEAFITSSYKAQMIKDKAWQTQQDIIDRRNEGPTAAGMAGGFLSHLLNEPSSPPHPTSSEPELAPDRTELATNIKEEVEVPAVRSNSKQETDSKEKASIKLESDEMTAHSARTSSKESSSIGVKRERSSENDQPEIRTMDSALDSAAELPDTLPAPQVQAAPIAKPSKEELAKAARERYLKRKAQRQNADAAP